MTACERDVVLYFYDEMSAGDHARMETHLRTCAACRQRLDDLHAIRRALASQPVVDAPPAGDWSGFMQRLDVAVGVAAPKSRRSGAAAKADEGGFRKVAAIAAVLAIVAIGILIAARFRPAKPTQLALTTPPATNAGPPTATQNVDAKAGLRALRENSAEHLERSKLVVLGLAARDAQHTKAADWQYERQLAGTLLSDTRLYRLAAQERGATDVARVMRDLETVLLEASMTDSPDRESLQRVQRLIAKRDLVSKMQIVAGTAGL